MRIRTTQQTWPVLLAALATLLFTAPTALAADPAAPTPAPTPPPAGSCAGVPSDDAMPGQVFEPVRYRWTSRTNIWNARPALQGVIARKFPSMRSARAGVLAATTEHAGQAATYLVLDARQYGAVCWLQLRLPAFPNTKVGWVLRDDVVTERGFWQVEIDVSSRAVRAYRGGKLKLSTRAVVGARATPTPLSGTRTPFAIYDVVRGRPNTFMGSWQIATTALSPQNPAIGRIGLHGRGGASLADPIGSARSNGCIRMTNTAVTRLVSLVGVANLVGTPVVIVA